MESLSRIYPTSLNTLSFFPSTILVRYRGCRRGTFITNFKDECKVTSFVQSDVSNYDHLSPWYRNKNRQNNNKNKQTNQKNWNDSFVEFVKTLDMLCKSHFTKRQIYSFSIEDNKCWTAYVWGSTGDSGPSPRDSCGFVLVSLSYEIPCFFFDYLSDRLFTKSQEDILYHHHFLTWDVGITEQILESRLGK